jgi:hypothetical protein
MHNYIIPSDEGLGRADFVPHRGGAMPYSPKCVEWAFSEVGPEFIGNSSPLASVGALINFRRG